VKIIRCCCSSCGANLQVSEEHLGAKTKCPKCSAVFVIRGDSGAKRLHVAKPLADEPAGKVPGSGLPHIAVDPSTAGDRRQHGSRPAADRGREGDRTLRLALLISGAAMAVTSVIVASVFLLRSPPQDPPRGEEVARPAPSPSETKPPQPAASRASAPDGSILVLDWPQPERSDSILLVDGAPRPVPLSGKAEFEVEPGERAVVLKRRGYEPIEIAMSFERGARHHYKPAWQQAAPTAIEPDRVPRTDATALMPTGDQPVPAQPDEVKQAARAPQEPAMDSPPSPEQPAPQPETAPSIEDPEELLASKGLRASGDLWSLPGESELNRGLREAQKIWGEITRAQRELAKAQKVVDAGDEVMLAFVGQLGKFGTMLRTVRTAEDNNRIVGAMNELRAQMMARARQLEGEEKARDRAAAAAFAKAGEYEQLLIESRQLHGEVKSRYEALAADSEVAEAIRLCNQAAAKQSRLGPGVLFAGIDKRLAGLEAKVFSEAIPLRQGEGRLWYVPVVFNGQNTQEMAIDTGASVIALSFEHAQAVGLTPGPDARTVHAQIADGSVVACKLVFAQTVRVGKFTAENVECTVLPQGTPPSTPLLGLSFFKHFNFQIDSAQGRLIMSQIDMSATGERGPTGRTSSPSPPGTRSSPSR